MKLEKVLCCMFLLAFLALTLHKTQQLFTTDRGTSQQECFDYGTRAQCVERKTKDCARGP